MATNTDTETETLLTVAETAVMLDRSTKTVERIRAAGDLGFTLKGRRVYYRQSDVLAYLHRMNAPVDVPPRAS